MRLTRKVPMLLVCAAAFAFTAAQYSTYNSNDEPSSTGSYDIGPYGGESGMSFTEETTTEDANDAKKSTGKQSKDKKERSVRDKRSAHSFSPAFSGPQKSCPVCSSVRLKNNLYVDYSSGRIHVCSAACIDRVRRNPAAFADILVKRGEQLSNQ